MKKTIIFLLLSIVNCQLSIAQVGTWHNYLAYHDVQQIQDAGNDLFVLASNALYQYHKSDQSITTYDKVNGLSDTYITHIRWCQQAKRLIAVYSNMNIDLVEANGNVTNISDVYTKAIIGDKTLQSIRIDGIYAYLVCGFGIVKINMQRAEISDTYRPNHPEYPTSLPAEDNSDYDKYIDLVKTLKPGGPDNNHVGFLRFTNNHLYSCGGIPGGNFIPNIPGNIQVWDGSDWTIYQNQLETTTGHSYMDLATLDADPHDATHVFAGGRTGLYEFKNGKFLREYNYDNSELLTTAAIDAPSKDYTMVQTVKYDNNGSLWILNSGSPSTSLFEITREGQWISHDKKEFYNSSQRAYDNMVNAFFDSRGILWFCNCRFVEPAVICYQKSTDVAIAYKKFVNQDGSSIDLKDDGIYCLAEDKESNIWIGTTAGPIVIMKDQIGKSADEIVFTQVKVPRNDGTNYADYLLAGNIITSIAVDEGGRKWFATSSNGVYLISADNMTQIQHFTTDNSPLLSNNVQSVTINSATGEVFFGTENGLCSYISDATQTNEEMTSDNVWAYPNPVNPGYSGPITITGLSYNADVKILSANGALVFEGQSNGGTFVWYGSDLKGRRVASGVYMVVTATSTGEKGTVCKIAIVN